MNTKICLRLGGVAGGAVGLLVGLLHGLECCTPPQPPTLGQLALDGLVASLVAVFLAAAFACLVSHLRIQPVFTLALLIGLLAGALLGPVAYRIPNPGLALFLSGVAGALLGWVVCRILCGGIRTVGNEVSR